MSITIELPQSNRPYLVVLAGTGDSTVQTTVTTEGGKSQPLNTSDERYGGSIRVRGGRKITIAAKVNGNAADFVGPVGSKTIPLVYELHKNPKKALGQARIFIDHLTATPIS